MLPFASDLLSWDNVVTVADLIPQDPEANIAAVADCPERESLAEPGAFAGTAAVRCDVPVPATPGAKLLINGLGNVTFTGRQPHTAS